MLQALAALAPQWIVTCAENPARLALTSGIVWGEQLTQLNQIEQCMRDLTGSWDFVHYGVAVGIYWLKILAAGAMLYWSWASPTPGRRSGTAFVADPHRPVSLFGRCGPLLYRYLSQHRMQSFCAAELRHCSASEGLSAERSLQQVL